MTAPDRLSALLARRDTLVADGAMGTSLFALGLETGACPEFWNIEQPDKVAQVHAAFIDAGADIVLTNSFGANRRRLVLHQAEDRVHELNLAAARVARQEADRQAERLGRPILVAGSIGPTGDLMMPVGPLGPDEAVAVFAEQARGLAAGGADLLWIETLSATEELEAALAGAGQAGLPLVATLSFDTHGRTMMGVSPAAALAAARAAAPAPLAFGANCGVGPAQLLDSLLAMTEDGPAEEVALVAKGNCGIPQYRDGAIVYGLDAELMADYACLARDAGARIVGGCCGTGPSHLAAMATALRTRPRGPRPTREAVEALFGPIGISGAEGPAFQIAAPAPGPGRRRRRDTPAAPAF